MADFATVTATSSASAVFNSHPPNSIAFSSGISSIVEAADLTKPQGHRKRRRSSKSSSTITPEPKFSRAPNPTKAAVSPECTPRVLTGAAALAEEQRAKERSQARQISSIPARKTLGDLLGAQKGGMSRSQDAPNEATTLRKPPANVASSIKLFNPEGSTPESTNALQISSQSTASGGNLETTPAPTITTNDASVASPGQMDDGVGDDDEIQIRSENGQLRDDGADIEGEGRSSKAFTFPGPMLNAQAHRTSSLPQSGYGGGRDSNRSPSTKRHKCPYCSTDFTRHHNLKSHLLTHSHEKPYSCDTCEARFRRLHDLKRHTKLHTGERPHVCPRCDRSFARGDALARHNKGQGGCAGRRSSMGSFGGDEKNEEGTKAGDGDSMPGIMYTGEASHEPEHMDEDIKSPGGRSLPSIRKHEAPTDERHRHIIADHQANFQSRQSSTYPPVAPRQPTGGLYPPPTASPRGGSGPSSTQSTASLNQSSYPPPAGPTAPPGIQASGPNVFAQGGMTESPKPLSPGGMSSHQLGHSDSSIHRNRSPSLTQQFQQHQFGRRTGHTASPTMSLPPPHQGTSHSTGPQLPSLPGLNPPDARFTLHSHASGLTHLHSSAPNSLPGPPHGPHSPSYPPGNMSSANNSLSSHSTGPHTSVDRLPNTFTQPNEQLWAYIRSLEVKVDRLQDEVISLRSQLSGGPQHR